MGLRTYCHNKLHNFLLKETLYDDIECQYKFIYIHIPKAGGNGVLTSLFNKKSNGHIPLSHYYKVNKRKFKEFYKFTIVRDPYTRFVSAFEYLKAGGMTNKDKEYFYPELKQCRDVNHFIQRLQQEPRFFINVMNFIHFKPQTFFLCDYIQEQSFDFIGKQEEMGEAFEHLKAHFGLEGVELKRVNATKSKSEVQLTQVSKDFIYEIYKKDFLYLNYER